MEWWFNSTANRLCELGVAERVSSYDPSRDISDENCELTFKFPARQFLSDETSTKTDGYSAVKSKGDNKQAQPRRREKFFYA